MPFTPEHADLPRTSRKAQTSLCLGLLSLLCSLFAAIPAIVLGIISLRDIGRSQGRLAGKGWAISGIIAGLLGVVINLVAVAIVVPVVWILRHEAHLKQTTEKMKQVDLGVLQYAMTKDYFPPTLRGTSNRNGEMSWRVAILPHLDQMELLKVYDRNEPWDSAKNKAAVTGRVIPVYHNPSDHDSTSIKTNYLAIVGEGTCMQREELIPMDEITGGWAHTIVFVEADADRAVPWAMPADIDYDPQHPHAGLGNYRPGIFIAAFADGSVRAVPSAIDPAALRSMVNRTGEE